MSTYANKIGKEKNCYKMLSLVMMDTLGETAHHSNYLEVIFIQELGSLWNKSIPLIIQRTRPYFKGSCFFFSILALKRCDYSCKCTYSKNHAVNLLLHLTAELVS